MLKYDYIENNNITVKGQTLIELCEKFGICNKTHFLRLLELNLIKKINKFDIHIINYFTSEKSEKAEKYFYEYNIAGSLLPIFCDEQLTKSIFSDNKFIIGFVKCFGITNILDLLYNFNKFNNEIQNLLKLMKVTEPVQKNNKPIKKAKKSKKGESKIEPIENNNHLIKEIFTSYIYCCKAILNCIIDNGTDNNITNIGDKSDIDDIDDKTYIDNIDDNVNKIHIDLYKELQSVPKKTIQIV
jgi:Zn-dependent peptidase ImmA (M78 family)